MYKIERQLNSGSWVGFITEYENEADAKFMLAYKKATYPQEKHRIIKFEVIDE